MTKNNLLLCLALGFLSACGKSEDPSASSNIATQPQSPNGAGAQSTANLSNPSGGTEGASGPETESDALPFENLFEVAALYHSINPDRPVQYDALINQMRLPYTSDPNEKEKLLEKARQDIDAELKGLPTGKFRTMSLSYQSTPVYDKEIGGMVVEIPEVLYVTDNTYSIEIVNKKKFTFIPLKSEEEIAAADAEGFNKRKNSSLTMNFYFKVLDRKSSGLSASSSNKLYAEIKQVEFLTQKGVPIRTFKGL